ncbi:MAG TPA: aminotransferase class V-fold PLP-dependent enzyme [Polyangiaceae bacterium]|nr:aminotransferase class V-fold PLP-dependent enzyme [Polyangiaceae bacterium]
MRAAVGGPAPDFRALRARFSVLNERTYLATQCLGPFPDEMLADLDEYRRTLFLRKRCIPLWADRLEEAISLFERLLGAPPNSVALTPNATAAQAAVAAALRPEGGRDRILYTAVDFHSSRYLWSTQGRRGFSPHEVPADDDGAVPVRALAERIDRRTAVVALSLVSPRTGALADVRPVVEAARAAGALVVLDTYQAVGSVPIDVEALGVDVLVGGTHKWLCGGGMGLAFLYMRPELAESLEVAYPGWIGHREMLGFAEAYAPAAGARRFMQGTPAFEPIYSARAGLRFVLEVGLPALRARSLALTELLIGRARERGLEVPTPMASHARGGMVCLRVPEPERVTDALAEAGVDVDCRPGAGIRIGPHPCNTERECELAIDLIARHACG